jgi:two-component system response regulator VicR
MNLKSNILIVDCKEVTDKLSHYLKRNNYIVDCADTAKDAVSLASSNRYELFIVSTDLPDYNGFILCKEIRKISSAPIMIISNSNNEVDIVEAFSVGADEYIVKPLRIREIIVRVESLINRYDYKNCNKLVEFDNIVYNRATDQLLIDDREVALTNIEEKLMVVLIDHIDEIITHEQLIHSVWGWDDTTSNSVISTTINRLRNKIGKNRIATVRGQGYRLESKVSNL